jgi:hypothetical protein
MRKFALSYYVGMLILCGFIVISLLSRVIYGYGEWLDVTIVASILMVAILVAVWAAWRAEPHGK